MFTTTGGRGYNKKDRDKQDGGSSEYAMEDSLEGLEGLAVKGCRNVKANKLDYDLGGNDNAERHGGGKDLAAG